jgi:hypothetical protein
MITLKERLTGFMLMAIIVPLAALGYLILLWVGLGGKTERGRAGVRALDHFVNATVFNGYAWESVSSHAWRERERRWAKMVIWVTNRFQQDHCRRANKREQHVVDLILQKGLQNRTIRCFGFAGDEPQGKALPLGAPTGNAEGGEAAEAILARSQFIPVSNPESGKRQ